MKVHQITNKDRETAAIKYILKKRRYESLPLRTLTVPVYGLYSKLDPI